MAEQRVLLKALRVGWGNEPYPEPNMKMEFPPKTKRLDKRTLGTNRVKAYPKSIGAQPGLPFVKCKGNPKNPKRDAMGNAGHWDQLNGKWAFRKGDIDLAKEQADWVVRLAGHLHPLGLWPGINTKNSVDDKIKKNLLTAPAGRFQGIDHEDLILDGWKKHLPTSAVSKGRTILTMFSQDR